MSTNNIDIVSDDITEIVNEIRDFSKILEGQTILLIGGRGFLGTYFLKTILANNEIIPKPTKVVVIDNLITAKDKKNFKDPNVIFYEKDVSKITQINEKIDYIIHAASIASPIVYRKFPLNTVDVNYQGTRNILEIAKKMKVKGFLYLSSSEIYGDPKIIPTPETYWGHVSSVGPRACYDESKRLAETVSIIYFEQYGVPVKIVRPFNVYGPYLRPDDGRVIPDFLKNSIKKSEIIIHSDGTPTRSFCYVTDAMKAFFRVLLLGKPGSIFNVGNDEEISMKTLAEKIKKMVESVEIKFEKSDDPNYTKDNPQRRCPDLHKIKREVGYSPKINLDEGLRRTHEWYLGELK